MEPASTTYELTRFALLRGMGLIYAVGFLVIVNQWAPLVGTDGLLPVPQFAERASQALGGTGAAFWEFPSVFWLGYSDTAALALGWAGLVLALLVAAGLTNALAMIALWALYMSFVNMGQLFWGYGWETMTLETGFLCIFLCPLRSWRPFPRGWAAPKVVMWLLRWELFRVMFGAGLIKLRGDACWRDLTALNYHFETQPIPNWLSPAFHHLPHGALAFGVAFNHFVELVVPFFYFAPRPLRAIAGALTIIFQATLIASGNLSWLNWLTIVIALSCFDDGQLRRLVPSRWRAQLPSPPAPARWASPGGVTLGVLVAVVALLSIQPTLNLFSSTQAMNASFDNFRLVNTYGAFGSVGKVRHEIVLSGTRDEFPGPNSHWTEIEFKGKPDDPDRAPPWIAPYQPRLDWQIWFAAMAPPGHDPWLLHLLAKLLENDPATWGLLAARPFGNEPPRAIKADYYEYRFTKPGEDLGPEWQRGRWWSRKRLGTYLPPLTLDDPRFQDYLRACGWKL